jgi:hypothetical protein
MMMKKRIFLIFCVFVGLFSYTLPVFSQAVDGGNIPESDGETAENREEDIQATENTFSQEILDAEILPLPRTFRELTLGMSLDELKNALAADSLFRYRGDRDVSLLPIQEQTLIETSGFSFIRRAFFQLEEGNLFIMSFTLDTSLVDHYSVFTSFVEKYGEPNSLNPRQAVWENAESRISIERPLTVKYIDKIVFDELIEQSDAEESFELELRRDFLNDF